MDKEIKDLMDLMSEPLDHDNGARVREQVVKCEAWGARVGYMYREAMSELYRVRFNALLPKSSTMTEIDRKTRLEADTREYQTKADVLKDLQDAIKRRVSLAQTILKSITSEVEL